MELLHKVLLQRRAIAILLLALLTLSCGQTSTLVAPQQALPTPSPVPLSLRSLAQARGISIGNSSK